MPDFRKKKPKVAARAAASSRLRLHGRIAREVGIGIVSGRFRPDHVMDGEIEASLRRQVSRTAYREVIRILSAKGLLVSRPRIGTRVSEVANWHLLDPDVLEWMFSGTPRQEVIHGLFELRTVVEPAAAALAATRRKQEHLAEMRRALDEMTRHPLDEAEGRSADRDFHAA